MIKFIAIIDFNLKKKNIFKNYLLYIRIHIYVNCYVVIFFLCILILKKNDLTNELLL